MIADVDAPSAGVTAASGAVVLLLAAESPPHEVKPTPIMATSSEEADIANFFISKTCVIGLELILLFSVRGASLHVAVTAHTPAFQLITVMSVTRGETAPFHEQYLDSEHYDCQSEHQRRKAYVE